MGRERQAKLYITWQTVASLSIYTSFACVCVYVQAYPGEQSVAIEYPVTVGVVWHRRTNGI